jgi:hypothetical protein
MIALFTLITMLFPFFGRLNHGLGRIQTTQNTGLSQNTNPFALLQTVAASTQPLVLPALQVCHPWMQNPAMTLLLSASLQLQQQRVKHQVSSYNRQLRVLRSSSTDKNMSALAQPSL